MKSTIGRDVLILNLAHVLNPIFQEKSTQARVDVNEHVFEASDVSEIILNLFLLNWI